MSLLAYGLIALAILGSLGGLYYKVNHDGVVAGRAEVQAKWDTANAEARAAEAARSAKAAADLEAERKKRKVVVKERTVFVDREIEKLVASASCLSPDGVRTLNSAIDGKSAPRAVPDRPMPATRPPG